MDKITLKELTPYLPYDLKVNHNEWGDIILIMDVDGSNDRTLSILDVIEFGKPLLRPLSSLTKEITHNGETFVPVEWFEIGDDQNESPEYTLGNIRTITHLSTIAKHNDTHDLQFMPYGVIQKLIEWHFDVFDLIGRGLALPMEE